MPDVCGMANPFLSAGKLIHYCDDGTTRGIYAYDPTNDSNTLLWDASSQEVNGNSIGTVVSIIPVVGDQPRLLVSYFVASLSDWRPYLVRFGGPNYTSPIYSEILSESLDQIAGVVIDKNQRTILAGPTPNNTVYLAPLKVDGSDLEPLVEGASAKVSASGTMNYGSGLTVEFIAPWTSSTLLVAGTQGVNYRARRIDVSTKTETSLVDLNGIQVYFAKAINGQLLVNGLRLEDNKTVNLRFDQAGNLLQIDSTEHMKILDLVPL